VLVVLLLWQVWVGWLSVSVMSGVAVRFKNLLGPVFVSGVNERVVGIDVVG
jgi:hypothetical protein